MPNLYVYGAAVVLTLLLLGGVYAKGRSDASANCDTRVTALLVESQIRERNAQQQAIDASQQLEEARAHTQIRYKTITKEVERIVERGGYRAVCFDADGVRLANTALAGSSTPPGEPVNRVPRTP
jgi:hypothetical protein